MEEAQAEEGDAAPGADGLRINLGPAHSLVLCGGATIGSVAEPLRAAGGDDSSLIGSGPQLLLFRDASGSPAGSAAVPPRLLLEADGMQWPLPAVELAGWEQSGSAAVGLFRLDPADRPRSGLSGPALIHLEGPGGQAAAELPPGWIGALWPIPPVPAA